MFMVIKCSTPRLVVLKMYDEKEQLNQAWAWCTNSKAEIDAFCEEHELSYILYSRRLTPLYCSMLDIDGKAPGPSEKLIKQCEKQEQREAERRKAYREAHPELPDFLFR